MEKISKDLRKECLRLSNKCEDGNLQSAFSCIDILWVLYDKIMNWSPEMATREERDYFLISKGQATLALHSILKMKGMFEENEYEEIGQFDSRMCIQADYSKFNGGIENAAGSLGHGFPLAAGIALAKKIKKLPSKIYVLAGDGEFNEGSMWETCILASAKKLDNLCVIIDDNNSINSIVDMGSLKDKLISFGFAVDEVDGHNLSALEEVLIKPGQVDKPRAVIAKTLRGYGCRTLMSEEIWFHKSPSQEELSWLLEEVDEF